MRTHRLSSLQRARPCLTACLTGIILVCDAVQLTAATTPPPFVRLVPLPPPIVVQASEDYPGGNHKVEYLLDQNPLTEYSSASQGTDTFVEFDFGHPVSLAGFRHLDRNDPATVAASQLVLLDQDGRELDSINVEHQNRKAGVTFHALATPVTARRVRWHITRLGPQGYGTVGGAEVAFYEAGQAEALPRETRLSAHPVARADRSSNGLLQPVKVAIDYPYLTPIEARVRLADLPPAELTLSAGEHTLDFAVPVSDKERSLTLSLSTATGESLTQQTITVPPLRRLTVYILPHSHTDIGYTEIQTAIEEKQVNNLLTGIEAADRTAAYPEGARFVWNVEVLWAADLYLRRMNADQQQRFFDAVQRGQVALCGMYLNELTGLCRPEELVRLFRLATQLRQQTGAALDTAMISDVPGYTWGTVPAMAAAGIRYFSVAPNYFDRIGNILVEWENKPFWWLGPDSQSKVLVWIPFWGYAMSHRYGRLSPELVDDFQAGLEERNYPYDIAYVRWAGHGDNATPDPAICDFVKDWGQNHAWPRFVISSASQAFQAFEERYGDQLPQVRGDWTPYWEDGAGSSAAETALNRASSDRVAQAETLWALHAPTRYPSQVFADAWRKVLLYSEHTWGAWCSVSEPHRKETLEQWSIKRSYAAAADLQSRALLDTATALAPGGEPHPAIDLYNTTSWPRTELVVLPRDLTENGNRILDDSGQPAPSQRLANGDLVLLARDIPPLAARRFTVTSGEPHQAQRVSVSDTVLDNGLVRIELDPSTGAITELRRHDLDHNLADTRSGRGLNDYLYLLGDNPDDLQPNGPVTVRIKERGPLVASLLVTSSAPGCHRLEREIRLVAGLDHVELINLVDKQRLVAASYHAREGKESVNFAFPFAVPDGQVRLEVPFGVLRPDLDQIPSACKNWFTVNRWADVANADYGITWVTLDAPLVQVGGVTATLLNSQTNPNIWRRQVGPTQTLVSWAMNNHWGTNYRAHQEGPVVFHYLLRPHLGYDPAAASRLAIAPSQPLLPVRARGPEPDRKPFLQLSSEQLLVTGLKPSDDGQALIVRLWNASDQTVTSRLEWRQPSPLQVSLSDTSESAGPTVSNSLEMPAWALTTLRAELPAH